ncbi:MAG: hypothetical protein HY553_02855 [Elusimicrobia bacterium]|nr:hypothetical protein [Elusimicrobiota bacterium]
MKRSLLCVAVLLGAASSGRAQWAEELKGFGDVRLQLQLGQGLSLSRGWQRTAAIPGKDDLTRFLQERSQVLSSDGYAAPTAAAVSVDLSRLHNRNWKTPATFTMGGQKVFVGGAFDRSQNAFISAYVDGWTEPKFFNIKGLLDKEGSLTVGSAAYGVSLSANVLNPMKSQIVFENKADEEDQSRISVKKLLDSLNAAGETVKLSDQSYQLFYYSDVKEGASGPAVDPNSRTFAMILTEGDEMHVFLIPAESVPAAQVAVFKMFKDKRVGLQLVGITLKVFENP